MNEPKLYIEKTVFYTYTREVSKAEYENMAESERSRVFTIAKNVVRENGMIEFTFPKHPDVKMVKLL